MPVVHLQRSLVRGNVAKHIRFKPLQDHTLKVGLSEGDFPLVFIEDSWVVLKVQLALDKESMELFRVSAIKGIRFTNLGSQ